MVEFWVASLCMLASSAFQSIRQTDAKPLAEILKCPEHEVDLEWWSLDRVYQ